MDFHFFSCSPDSPPGFEPISTQDMDPQATGLVLFSDSLQGALLLVSDWPEVCRLIVTVGESIETSSLEEHTWHLQVTKEMVPTLRDTSVALLMSLGCSGMGSEQNSSELVLQQERAIFVTGPVVVFKWRNEENWPIEYVSPNVEKIFGYSVAEMLSGNVPYASLIPRNDLERVGEEVVAGSFPDVMHFSHEPYRINRKDGRMIWVDDHTTVLRDEQGEISHYLGYVHDITSRVLAEDERRSLEQQVQHAQKLESLGVLAGGIAHDFNNLLVAILGNADLALEELSPMSPARSMIKEIEKASLRAADLAKQMLAYSGKGRFVVEPVDAGELLKEMSHLLEVSISKNVVIKYNLADNIPKFAGDATQIRQIIMNLITNASEAIDEQSGVIALSTGAMTCDREYLATTDDDLRAGFEEAMAEGDYVYFEVADTGSGMDSDIVAKVFDPFFTTKFKGRGLGMSAVLGIVRGHGGTIKIYSEVGQGTTFKVLFPVCYDEFSDISQVAPGEDVAVNWQGSGTVLIADDEDTVLVVAKRMFESMGFDVMTAPDGRKAVEIYREKADEIVCVLLDLTMPHLGGEGAFCEMRRIRPDVSVILCSGYNEQDVIQRFVGKGLAGFIQKPFTTAGLRGVVRKVLE